MFVVVAYDIVDDRKRLRVAKLMKSYGVRVQKSVFECILDDRRYLKMKEQVEKLIDWEDDGVRYYILCAGCVKNIDTSGVGVIMEDEDVIVV
ncbi:MAG: CRISPR-associated endonuclease Cas2 [Deltaproteobacteria bacterium]|jgi:CRISPR-associated protein Cas2|nr:CRISPR-associated endonuclease Cas2 [Deltaproteobacteria bacterium]